MTLNAMSASRSAPQWSVLDRVLALTTDGNGVITWCSPALERLLGHRADTLVGEAPPRWLFDEEELTAREAATGAPFGPAMFLADPRRLERRRVDVDLGRLDRRARRGPRERRAGAGPVAGDRDAHGSSCDWTLRARDGRRVVLSVTVQALGGYDHDGYLVLGMEVTAERATSRLLAEALEREKAAARRLEEVQRLRDEFISVASHELRTPLTSILGYLDLLEGHLDGSPAAEQVVGRVRRNAARISHLAEQLVVLAEERQVHSQRAAFDLRTAVRTAVRAAQVRAGQGDVAVDEAADPVPVCGDARELEQTVTHLVDNALKFSGPRALVRCRVGADAGKAFVEVADEGPGISQAEREHVFDEFSRGAAAHRDCAPGSGVGLSVVRRVVSRHGGEVRIGDNEPRGTVVTVLLPLLPDGAR